MENLIRRLGVCHTCVLKSFFKPFSSYFVFSIFSAIGCNNKSDFYGELLLFSLFFFGPLRWLCKTCPDRDQRGLFASSSSFFFCTCDKSFLQRAQNKMPLFHQGNLAMCLRSTDGTRVQRQREASICVQASGHVLLWWRSLCSRFYFFLSSPPKVTLLCDDCTCWLNCIILLLLFSYHYNWFA